MAVWSRSMHWGRVNTAGLCVVGAIAFGVTLSTVEAQGIQQGPEQARDVAEVVQRVGPSGGSVVERTTPQSAAQQRDTNLLAKRFSIDVTNVTLKQALDEIIKRSGVSIIYNHELLPLDRRVSLQNRDIDLRSALKHVLKGTGTEARIANANRVVIDRIPTSGAGADTAGARTGTIIGTVIDSSTGKGISGVSVQVPDVSKGAVSGERGEFVISGVPVGTHTVTFRLIGYTSSSQTVKVEEGGQARVRVVLRPAATALSEVVTTATGSQRRVEVANDIVKIDVDEIRDRAPVRSVTDIIEAAQVPGVLVSRGSGDPGAPSRIRIRGIGSISQSNDPVMMIDGVWVDASVQSLSRLESIDPATIETIEIVRGPSAATLYGQDAANGIIVITTKKGQVGQTRWNATYSRDWGQPYGKIPLQYRGVGHNPLTGASISCPIASVVTLSCVQDSVLLYDANNPLLAREGTETNNRVVVSIDGGTQTIRYALTGTGIHTLGVRRIAPIDLVRFKKLGFQHRNEFTRPSALTRQTFTSNLTMLPKPEVTIQVMTTIGQSNLKDNNYDVSFASPDFNNLDTMVFLTGDNRIHAVENPTRRSNVTLGASVLWSPPGGWVVSGNIGIDRNWESASSFTAWTQCNAGTACVDSFGTRSEQSVQQSVNTFRLNIARPIGLGRLSRFLEIRPSFGGDYRKNGTSRLFIEKNMIPPGERSLVNGILYTSNYDRNPNATAGWYLNSTIGVFRRVYFDLGIRQDIGSAITSSNNARYPKLGGSWLISDESFWPQNPWVSQLRLRGALGYSAVQPDIGDIHGHYRSGYQFIDGKFVRGVELVGAGNPSLNPERAMEIEMGFDMDLFQDRVNLIATYAHGENQNALVNRNMPPSVSGIGTIQRKENIARVRNRNFEVSATGRLIETRNTLVVLNYNLTLSDNVVVKLGDGILPFSTATTGRIVAGYPIAGIWARRVLGYQDHNEDGLLARNEVILSDSAVYIGWSQPRYRAGYGANITLYNQLTFDTRFSYQSQYVQQYSADGYRGNEDVNAPFSEQAYGVISGLTGRRPISDVRWNSASITYHVPASILRKVRARSLSFSLQGSNLGLWTNYVGRDPGVNSSILTSEVPLDNGSVVPRPRLYVFDVRIGF
jgi:TonB-dependent SusC/RagA subfamily outer membrane receptor